MRDTVVIVLAAALSVAIIYIIYLYVHVIIPLRKMKKFSDRIKSGNFDVPDTTDTTRAFGMFSESYNIVYDELRRGRQRESQLKEKEKEALAKVGRKLTEPLNAIKLSSELMRTMLIAKEGEDNAYMLDKIEKIYDTADAMSIDVGDMLTGALDDLGEYIVNIADVESRILEDMVRKSDHRHVVSMTPVPYVLIHIDALRMRTVIENIIDNSYRYANTQIDVTFLQTDEYLQMKISDHGPGVFDDEIDLITGKFYRGRAWADSVEKGEGQGLYIASTLMEKMDGKLYVENTGEGLCVTLLVKISGN